MTKITEDAIEQTVREMMRFYYNRLLRSRDSMLDKAG